MSRQSPTISHAGFKVRAGGASSHAFKSIKLGIDIDLIVLSCDGASHLKFGEARSGADIDACDG